MAKRRLKSPIKTISSIAPTFGDKKNKGIFKETKKQKKEVDIINQT